MMMMTTTTMTMVNISGHLPVCLSVSVLVFACTSKPHISNVLLHYRADYLAHESQLHSLVSITRKYIFYLQINLLM